MISGIFFDLLDKFFILWKDFSDKVDVFDLSESEVEVLKGEVKVVLFILVKFVYEKFIVVFVY